MARSTSQFQTVRSEGALLPPDVLRAIASQRVEGTSPESYHLPPGTKLNEAIAHSWSVLQKYWKGFQEIRGRLPEQETGTEVTNQNWLLPLFEELKYGRLVTTKAPEIDGRTYPIERFYARVPIHLVGCNLPLDRRTKGARGAATASPHSMMQEFLNRREESLWGFFTNGLVLRILRDNVSLSRQAYVEFDLEAMMEGEVYADFALLWMLCHQSRVEGDKPQEFWLEKWSQLAREQGTRVLSHLRNGVARAIEALGRGFLAHPHNDWLRQQLQDGQLDKQEYYRQVLRIVYRLLFLFVAEDRGLLHGPDADPAACELYDVHYSTRRLRELADQIRGSKHADLWHSLSLVFDALDRAEGCPHLGLPALGSFLWRRSSISAILGPAYKGAEPVEHPVFITNDDLLAAVRALAFVEQDKARRSVDYRNLGSEELGSVYESLLELHPAVNIPGRTFELDIAAGHERKTTGSYYTPDSLVQCLLDSALEPVVAERIKGKKADDSAKAILDLKVCDPACGSGHFLIAAAHRLARHLARLRSGETEPSPVDYQHALRDVISHCIYGVDINPMAVELCRVSLWIEALEPGKPLSFLDHHIQSGNSLVGVTPRLLSAGIPDEAFKAIERDDGKACQELKADNKREQKDHQRGYRDFHVPYPLGNLPAQFARLTTEADETVTDVAVKETRYVELIRGTDYQNASLLADTWCSTFFWIKDKTDLGRQCPTERIFRRVEASPHSLTPDVCQEIERLREEHGFFHWHLAFPDVFRLPMPGSQPENEKTGWNGGFALVLGNPPWERVKIQEREFFETRAPEIANARTASARGCLIQNLVKEDEKLFREFMAAKRKSEGIAAFLRESKRFPFGSRGDINTYPVFAELNRDLIAPDGQVGCVVPTGLATDDTYKEFFQELMETHSLVSLISLWEIRRFFPDTDSRDPFSLLTLSGSRRYVESTLFAFDVRSLSELTEPSRLFSLSTADIALLNPNTKTCPVFSSGRSAEVAKWIYRRCPVIVRENESPENPWYVKFGTVFHSGNDSYLFRELVSLLADEGELSGNLVKGATAQYLPLYEQNMIHMNDHRFASYQREDGSHDADASRRVGSLEHAQPDFVVLPKFWVDKSEVDSMRSSKGLVGDWTIAFRKSARIGDIRTGIFCVMPNTAVSDSIHLIARQPSERVDVQHHLLLAQLSSFVFDFAMRQSLGGANASFYIVKQLPVLPPQRFDEIAEFCRTETLGSWVTPRILELTYTAWDIKSFAEDCGYGGPPFRWDDDRRFAIRCELDAAFFHRYLGSVEQWREAASPELLAEFPVPKSAVEYIMDSFATVQDNDNAAHGEYRTKRAILEIYDEMARAIQTGQAYQSRLAPPPGPPCNAVGNSILMAQWDRINWPVHIHHPKETVLAVPEEVSVAEFGAMAYPSSDTDRAICAAALAVVEQSGGLSSMEHLDSLLLATHPDWCKAFLDKRGQAAFNAAHRSAPAALFVNQGHSIRWKECRDYLEQLNALTVAHSDKGQLIGVGTALTSAKTNLPTGVDGVVKYALMALTRIRELRRDSASVPQAQRLILDVFEAQHRLCGLAA